MRYFCISLFICTLSLHILAYTATGTVYIEGEPAINAEVFWNNTTLGTTTDLDGKFTLESTPVTDSLSVRYLGFNTETVVVNNSTPLKITLTESGKNLEEVHVSARAAASVKSRISAVHVEKLTGDELCKAACCNLSESFETNASVDVAYSDAATGAKQIKMLGLSGTYVQLLTENAPGVRGLATNYGMEFIPGSWMESIQVSKGTSSVINGYEATTGQINIEYLKPQKADPIAINLFLSSALRAEINATGGWDITKNLSTAVLAHVKNESMEHDTNRDGFIDIPKGSQYNLLNRWYYKKGNYTGQFLVRGLYDERIGGQLTHDNAIDNPYTIDIRTKRIEGLTKNGYVFDHKKNTSLGVIISGSYHDQQGIYGHKLYQGAQTNIYANAIFQTNLSDDHKLVTGLSFNYDKYDEDLQLNSNESSRLPFDRIETTPGVFAEYSYNYHEHLSLLAGIRADYSSLYGIFVTPRLNIRYSPWEWWNIRSSVGMGYRSPNIISDNSFMLPSNREAVFAAHFNQEKALNTGISSTFYIPIGSKELQLSAEYYYTHFFESVVADMDTDPHKVLFYNSNGTRSYAGNFQVEANMEVVRGWTMTVAWRMTDVKQTINGTLREKPLTNRFKGLITTSYQTPLKKWQFDFTAQFNGGGRMPDPDKENPLWEQTFNWYPILMAQVTKYFRTWSVYLGGENITNFTQKNPIIDAQNPYGSNFDASMAWGPIHGAKLYVGFRWALDRKEN